MKQLYALSFFLFFVYLPAGARYFEYTPNARLAYEKTLALRFGEARSLLDQIRKQDPGNLIVYHIENYIDFLTVYINEDEAEYKRLRNNRDLRLARVEAGDASSPYYLFIQADIRLQWALARLKFGEYLGAFTDVNRAYKLLQRNQQRFPDFMPNYKDLSILHAMVGTIPDNYKWGVKLLSSLDGTIPQGRRELEQVLRYARHHDFIFREETYALYAFLLLHLENQEEEAWQTIQRAGLDPRSNLLHCFVQANIAMRSGHNDEAIRILQQRPAGAAYQPFPYLDFMLGLAKLRRLDNDADVYLHRYVARFDGQNFIKEAYQKLAWHALIRGDLDGYRSNMQACRLQGKEVTGSDASAQKEALDGTPPQTVLLKARLLFDGGYFRQAYQLLAPLSVTDFSGAHDRLEFLYRMGRILHGLQQYPQALHYYQLTIEAGRNDPAFFACNAALQSGLICETLSQPDRAISFFNQCLALRPDEHRTGLHQGAKAGIARIRQEQK